MVDAGLLALKQYGTRSFEETIQPALELADGFPIDNQRAGSIAQAARFLQSFPISFAVYTPDGKVPRPGDIFRQRDLATTLRAMIRAEQSALAAGKNRELAIDAVRDYFYRGAIAREIGDFVKKNGGLLRYEDMASFRLETEEPIVTTFQDYEAPPVFWTQSA
jgi:gamma-glutamyltranspeptidase/glutathione hydrolase